MSVFHETCTICNVDVSTRSDRRLYPPTAEGSIVRNPTTVRHFSLMLIEPGEVHRNTKTPPPDPFSVVFIESKVVNDVASKLEMPVNRHFREAVVIDPSLHQAFQYLHAVLAGGATLLHRQSLLLSCIGTVLAGFCEQTPRSIPRPGG